MSAIRYPRNALAHPVIDKTHSEQWKEIIRTHCPNRRGVTDESIAKLVKLALDVFDNK